MTKLHFEEHIQASQEDIYKLLIDLAHYEDWLEKSAFFVGIDISQEEPVQVGTLYKERGINSVINGEVTEMKPYRRVGLHQHRDITRRFLGGSLDIRIRYTLKPDEDKILVMRDLLLTTHGIFRVLQWPLQSALRQENERVVKEIKRHFEAPPEEHPDEEKVLEESRDDEVIDESLEGSEEEALDNDTEEHLESVSAEVTEEDEEIQEELIENPTAEHSQDKDAQEGSSSSTSANAESLETH